MNRTAIIIVGEHGSGKSRLINQFIKDKLDMSPRQRLTSIADKRICIKSQTLQEAEWSIDDLNRYGDFDVLVLPSWPNDKGHPTLAQIVKRLRSLGYRIREILWDRSDGDQKCKEVSKEIAKIVKQ